MKKVFLIILILLAVDFIIPATSYAAAGHSELQEQLERQQAQPSQASSSAPVEQDARQGEATSRNEKIERTELKFFGPFLYQKIEVLHVFHDRHPILFILGLIAVIFIIVRLIVYIIKYWKKRRD